MEAKICLICKHIYISHHCKSYIADIFDVDSFIVITDDSNRIKVVSYEDRGSDYVNASPIDVCYYHAMKCYIETVSLGL